MNPYNSSRWLQCQLASRSDSLLAFLFKAVMSAAAITVVLTHL